MKNTKNLIAICVVAILSMSVINSSPVHSYLSMLSSSTALVHSSPNELYAKIEEAAKRYEAVPADAKIDRVWKAMPGYNGIKVDIEASYKKMKKDKRFNEKKLVFTQVAPSVHLKDLPPAPVYRGYPEKPMVAFIINVAWGNEYLPDMLAILKKNNIHVSFFLEGRWVKENPELARMIADGGHELGNHSYTHPNMTHLSAAETRAQLQKTNDVIEATTGKKVKWFGPPAGTFRDETVKIARSLDMGTVMWTVDTIDWQKPSPNTIIKRVTSKVGPGSLILMHPTDSTAKALPALIDEMKARQLRIGTVTRTLDEERIVQLQGDKGTEEH